MTRLMDGLSGDGIFGAGLRRAVIALGLMGTICFGVVPEGMAAARDGAAVGVLQVAQAAPGAVRHYDAQGRYQGRTDASGRAYDSQGRYVGREEASGRHYDAQGRYQGRDERSSAGDVRHYDASGRYQGRQSSDGRQYDAQGRYQGRVDTQGRRYDAQGRYTGKSVP